MKHLIFFLLLTIIFQTNLFSQSTPRPTPPSGGTNGVSYSKSENAYIFSYSGPDGNLNYKYSLDNGGYLNGLTVTVNGSYTFWPSYGGGIAVNINNTTFYSWQSNVSF